MNRFGEPVRDRVGEGDLLGELSEPRTSDDASEGNGWSTVFTLGSMYSAGGSGKRGIRGSRVQASQQTSYMSMTEY